jgi:hypothetical protein
MLLLLLLLLLAPGAVAAAPALSSWLLPLWLPLQRPQLSKNLDTLLLQVGCHCFNLREPDHD